MTPRNLDLHALECLDMFLRERSVSCAAERLGLTPSGISRSITKLEKAGANRVIPLFETSAYKMAQLLSHPDSGELLDAFLQGSATLNLGTG